MQKLIKDILNFSKLSAETEPFIQTDLTQIAREAVEELSDTVQAKNAEIQIDHLPSLPVNPNMIRSLFFNLVGNALKYSKKNTSPLIKIYAEKQPGVSDGLIIPDEKKYYRIFIQDNGIGFNQQYAEQIFEMFKRLHSSTEYEGTGIGLALCKQIMVKHNGFISALSKENEGAVFIVSLPMIVL